MTPEESAAEHKKAHRLAVLEAVLWGMEHPAELLAIVRESDSDEDAIQRLVALPYQMTEFEAQHVLDLQFRSLAASRVELLRDEVEIRRRGEEPPTGAPTFMSGPQRADPTP